MKKFLLIFLFLNCFGLCSQTIISGKITVSNQDDDEEEDSEDDNGVILKGFNYTKKIPLNTEKFQDTIANEKSNHYKVIVKGDSYYKDASVYLPKNEHLRIKFNDSIVTFQGKKSTVKINIFLKEEQLLFNKVLKSAVHFFTLKEDEFLKLSKQHKKAGEKLIQQSKLPKEYANFRKRVVNYTYVRNIQNYEKFHKYLIKNDDFKVSRNFPKNEIKEIDLNNVKDFKNSFQYRLLIEEYFTNKAGLKSEDDKKIYLDIVNKEIKNSFIKNDLLFKYLKLKISDIENLDAFFKKYLNYTTNNVQQQKAKEIYEEYNRLSKGKPSPKFFNYKTVGEKKISLDDILHKGKKVYIGIWATWCGFCRKENYLLEGLIKKYKRSNLEVVMICMEEDDEIRKWKKILAEGTYGGIQLFSGKDFKNSNFCKKYKIVGLPRFILIDEKGKIISQNAPRLSVGDKLDDFFKENGIQVE